MLSEGQGCRPAPALREGFPPSLKNLFSRQLSADTPARDRSLLLHLIPQPFPLHSLTVLENKKQNAGGDSRRFVFIYRLVSLSHCSIAAAVLHPLGKGMAYFVFGWYMQQQ